MNVEIAKDSAPTTTWHRMDSVPSLSDDVVHVWHLTVPQIYHLKAYEPFIAAEEVDRAKLFHREIDALRFMLGRVGLRSLLASYCDVNPLGVRLVFNEYGKPQATLPSIQFSICHSGDSILWAFSRSYEVGVDVESTPIKQVEEFRSIFSHQEMNYLAAQPNERRVKAFHRLWARKEACLKAAGCGFSLDPRLVDVLTDEVRMPVAPQLLAQLLHLQELTTPSGETAAVAITGPRKPLISLDFSSLCPSPII
jgi:4'-phosphopantetheinyl transferase